jgi:myo-inositol-1(or 4)-monophosphatase
VRPYAAELAIAERAARAASAILAAADGPRGVRHKGSVDLVTELDLQCEAVIREIVTAAMPDVPVLGEEGGGLDVPTRWVVDPLDGTTNFVHGFPVYAVSIALEVDGASVVGVIADPVRRRLYTATRGGGAFVDAVQIAVSQTDALDAALVATGFAYDRRERPDYYVDPVRRALRATQGVRRGGAAAMDLAWVAEGRLDGYFERHLHRWDAAAGELLVTEAGGRISAWDGGPLDRHDVCVIASNGALHDALQEMLR